MFQKGQVSWNKGLTKETNLILKRISEKFKLNNPSQRPEVAKKISETKKRRFKSGETISWNKGKKCPQLSECQKGSKNHQFGKRGKGTSNWKGGKIEFICQYCGKKFKDYPSRKGKRIYCGYQCMGRANIERELKEGIRKGFATGQYKKENHPLWKGGISTENHLIRGSIEYKLWGKAVFIKDSWTCQKCKLKGIYLHSHHIQNFADYPELRFVVGNGITFCEDCHKKFHKRFGYTNNTKEQLEEYLA